MESGVGKLPVSAEWNQRRCRPTESGIQKVYKLRWSELPGEFLKFAEGKPGLTDVVAFVRQVRPDQTFENNDSEVAKPQLKALDKVLGALKRWVPTEGKQYEDGYHAELLQYLRNACKFDVRQRWGDSEVDLAVMGNSKPIGIELKKGRGMSQAECDRLFGQLIRHLENCSAVVAVICHPDNGDLLDNFERNVRNVYGKLGKSVSVLKK